MAKDIRKIVKKGYEEKKFLDRLAGLIPKNARFIGK